MVLAVSGWLSISLPYSKLVVSSLNGREANDTVCCFREGCEYVESWEYCFFCPVEEFAISDWSPGMLVDVLIAPSQLSAIDGSK